MKRTTEGTPTAIFDRMAERYDDLRGREEQLAEQFEFTVGAGLGAATRLLDVGCGTGSLVATAVERLGVRAWGIDASEEMLAKARARRVRGAAFKHAQADDLPFRAGWFDAVMMRLVVHTLGDRRLQALAEARRVLAREGRLFVWTFEPDHFTGHHLRSYLPDLPAIDLARFPSAELLTGELAEAGFGTVEVRWFQQTGAVSRKRAAEQLRARHLSTIHLLPDEQVIAAAERLEREAAAAEPELATVLRWQLVVARAEEPEEAVAPRQPQRRAER
jgi:cyclopropane fatty-acyl-phospholipid synthase-like methyltransferase